MTRTFLVALNVESTLDLNATASELLDSLTNDGFDVESVKPWASTAPGALEQTPPPFTLQPPVTKLL